MLNLSQRLRNLLDVFKDANDGQQPFTQASADAFAHDLKIATEDALRLELTLCGQMQTLDPDQLDVTNVVMFPGVKNIAHNRNKNER